MSLNPCTSDWQGQSIWIIGASSGIGLATAQALHARGAVVTVSARNAQALADLAAAHPGMQALPLDVRDAKAVQSAADSLFRDEVRDFLAERLTPDLRRVGRSLTSVYATYDVAMAWQAIGHGADDVSYWQWRSALNGQEEIHGVLVGPDGIARGIRVVE